MIYCVVPRELVDDLYPKLVKHYEHDEHVTVIVDRRKADRRARGGRAGGPGDHAGAQRRVVRDRRRARVPGDLPPLAQPS
jgi:hypothetical protein